MIDARGQIIPRPGVVVGIRFSRLVTPEWAIGLATQNFGMGVGVVYGPIHCANPKTGSTGLPRDLAAEMIVDDVLANNVPYVMFLDDDVELPFGACRHLMDTLASADDDVMVVGGIYCTKEDRPQPVVFKDITLGPSWRWKRDTIFPCELIGLGCTLWKSEVFRKIPKPWFRDIDTPKFGCTDDAFFFAKLKLHGFKALADAYVLPVHWDYERRMPFSLPPESYPMLPAGMEQLFRNLPDGWMETGELAWLSTQAAERKLIVEVGSFIGRSTVMMARSTSGKVVAIDDFKGPRNTVPQSEYSQKLMGIKNIFGAFKENVSDLPNVSWIQADHGECAKFPPEWVRGGDDEKPDMVFIDGSHEYEDVKRDIMIWKSRLAPKGLLCGHDTDWPGVRKAIDELLPGWKPEAGTIWSYQP